MTKTKAIMRSRLVKTEKFPCVFERADGGRVGRSQMAVGWRMSRMLRSGDFKDWACEEIGLWRGGWRCICSWRGMCYPGKTKKGNFNLFNCSLEWCSRNQSCRISFLVRHRRDWMKAQLINLMMVDCQISHPSPCIFWNRRGGKKSSAESAEREDKVNLREWRRLQRFWGEPAWTLTWQKRHVWPPGGFLLARSVDSLLSPKTALFLDIGVENLANQLDLFEISTCVYSSRQWE